MKYENEIKVLTELKNYSESDGVEGKFALIGAERAEVLQKAIDLMKSQPSEEDIHREREQAYMLGYEDASKKFRTELKQRREADKVADAQLKELIEEVRK